MLSHHIYNNNNLNSIATYNVNGISVITLPCFLDLRASGVVLRFYWSMPLLLTVVTNKIRERHNTDSKVTSKILSSLFNKARVDTCVLKGVISLS